MAAIVGANEVLYRLKAGRFPCALQFSQHHSMRHQQERPSRVTGHVPGVVQAGEVCSRGRSA